MGGYELTSYQDAIRQGIEDEREPEDEDRGLMNYFDGDKAVDEKVVSVFTNVEELDDELYGVAVCQIKGSLSPSELDELKGFCMEQYADGWGEGYSQRPRNTDYGDLYVYFWQYDGFFIRTKEELEIAKNPVRPRPQRGDDAR